MVSDDVLVAGKLIQFLYPSANFLMAPVNLELRRIRIERIRDLTKEPLETLTLALDPMRKRGRTLVIGRDLDKNAERKFYVESMIGAHEIEPKHGRAVGRAA